MQSNTKILEEVHKLKYKFTSLESQLLVTKNVNSLLQQRVVDLDRQIKNKHSWKVVFALTEIGLL